MRQAVLVTTFLAGANAFAPAAFHQQHHQHRAATAVRMNVETMDFTGGSVRAQRDVVDDQMRPRPSIDWSNLRAKLELEFGMSEEKLAEFDAIAPEDLLKAYETMQLCRQFENACNQAYMQGHIRGFMHLDNGQETIPALVADAIKVGR